MTITRQNFKAIYGITYICNPLLVEDHDQIYLFFLPKRHQNDRKEKKKKFKTKGKIPTTKRIGNKTFRN
jgi:hypothetical protein